MIARLYIEERFGVETVAGLVGVFIDRFERGLRVVQSVIGITSIL